MKIKQAQYITSGTRTEHLPEDVLPEFLFCGRSNVGKSSFINGLCNHKGLAKTSSNPGKTQTLNYFFINKEFYFVDVPGYGYAKVSKSLREAFGEMIEHYLTTRKNLRVAFLLIDYRHPPTTHDIQMYEYLKYCGIKTAIILTKRDKLNQSERAKNKNMIIKHFNLEKTDTVIETSSEEKFGIEKTLLFIEENLN
ncbi:MAG: ribosome biogenesis GTP-binding protein YihA/YsxC [bacterium]